MPDIKEQPLESDWTQAEKEESVLSVASLFDNSFSIDWLAELTGKRITLLISELEEARKEGLIANKSPGVYAFQDKATQKKFQTALEPREKINLLEQISKMLLNDFPRDIENDSEPIANQLLEITNSFEGCRYLMHAGDVHLHNYNQEMAFKCYSKVLGDLSDKSGEATDNIFIDTAIKFSKISTAQQDTDKVLGILNTALERADANGDKRCQALIEMHIAKNEWLKTRYDGALNHFEKGWAQAKELDDPKLKRAASTFSTFFLFWQGRFKEAIENYEQSVPDIDRYPNGEFPLLAALTVGFCYAQIGQVTQGLGMLYAIRSHCIEKGDMYLAAYASGNIGEILLRTHRIDEAIYYLTLSDKEAQKTNNNWVLITVQLFLAYSYYLKGKNQLCLNHLRNFINKSNEVKISVNIYPYLISLAMAMRKGELPSFDELSLNSMVRKYTRGKNIFMKGIGYRYQAFMQMEENAGTKKVVHSLNQSIECLEESGQCIELAKSRLELARIKLANGEKVEARQLADSGASALSELNENLIPDDLVSLIETRPKRENLLKEILKLGQEMVAINDNKDLIQYIISTVNKITGAERGAIFLWNKDKTSLQLRGSKNLTSAQITHPEFASSYRLIEEVAKSGKGCIKNLDTMNSGQDFSCQPLRSRICVPLILRNHIMGALYHDNRLLNSGFQESDMEILSYFAAMAAFALDNVQAYQEIKRLNKTLRKEKQYYQEEHNNSLNFKGIVGKSPAIAEVMEKITQVADTGATVLIEGETGVGKELVARAVHDLSQRKKNPFISVHCSALPENLISSELFGHEKGAFTGAQKKRTGRFELAHHGTLFLDEIGTISTDTQIRLLRVLQTKEFERVGGTETLHSDFRLIAATNKELADLVQSGHFQSDLYYRINIFPIHVPPLRERKEDIPLLAEHFLHIYANKMGKDIRGISESDMARLQEYEFPGNIRELQNIIERACILSTGRKLRLPEFKTSDPPDYEQRKAVTLQENERQHILWGLQQTNWKVRGKGGAAELLDIHPSTLTFRMKKLGIQRPD